MAERRPLCRIDGITKELPSGDVLPDTVKNNFAATAPPTASNDSTQGYSAGSSWMVPSTGDMWRARSVAVGAARWVRMDLADHPGYVAGRYYSLFGAGIYAGGAALALNTVYLHFGLIKERITVSQLGARVSTVGAGGNFQLAVYAHNAAAATPGALIASTGSGSTATAAIVNTAFSASQALEPGIYWFALQVDNTTAVFLSVGSSSTAFGSTIGSATGVIQGTSTTQLSGLSTPTTAFGTWPADLSGATFTELLSRSPAVQFLVASVP